MTRGRLRTILLIALCLVSALNLVRVGLRIGSDRERARPFVFYGTPFERLRPLFEGETHIGYFTSDTPSEIDQVKFLQVQYALAPLVLDKFDLHHRFILLDCVSDQEALAKIDGLGLDRSLSRRLGNGRFIVRRP